MSVHSLLDRYSIRPKKRMGQNFLVEEPTIAKIVKCLAPSSEDKVLEIGPGIGVMTKLLAERSKFVTAIEADADMIRLLENEYGSVPNLHVIHGDALDADLEKLLGTSGKWLFAGNIPYNITSPLLFHLREHRRCFRYGVLTMQKEVANRLLAKPRSKDYGILTIALQAVAKVEKCFNISPSSFFPAPKVDSTVVRISFEDAPHYDIEDLEFFTRVVRAAFGTRRKKLKNSLMMSSFLDTPRDRIEAALASAGIDDNSRAEELPIETFANLARLLG